MDKYWISSGGFIDIQGITINPNVSARVQSLCCFSGGVVQMKFVDITGDEYTNWGNDDNYLIALVGHKLGMGQRVQHNSDGDILPIITPSTTQQDGGASEHNAFDVAKIENLQIELESQKNKLKTITDLLIGRGII